jgi:hypothetical protein
VSAPPRGKSTPVSKACEYGEQVSVARLDLDPVNECENI